MNKTRKVRKGGAGLLETLGFQKKSPFTTSPTITPGEAALEKEMKNVKRSMETLNAISSYAGFNASKNIQRLDEKRNKLRLQLANMRGKTGVLNIKVNPMKKGGGKRKTLRRLKRSTRRRHH